MALTWEQIIKLIVDGEAVNARVTNRPTQQLTSRTQYLYDRLVASALGEALYVNDVPVEDDAVPGDAMYFDDEELKYKRALAAVEFDTTFGWYAPAKSCYVIGVLVSKSNTGLGDICSMGMLRNFTALADVIEPGSSATAGALYLSMTTPGMMTYMKPPVGIYVGYNRGDDTIHVMPTPKDMLEDHIHHRHQLVAAPAGTPNCVSYGSGEVHEVVDPDSSLPGWLPADDPIFNGLAPEGAHFGYNLALHEDLLRVWPPQPLDSGYIEVNRGNGYVGLKINGETCPDVIINSQGIWWMNNCYGTAPWAPDYPCDSSSSGSSESPTACDGECQTPVEYLPGNLDPERLEIALWFTKMVFKTDASVVTSLQPDGPNSPVVFTDCDGEPATTGRLFAGLDLSKLEVFEPAPGYKVIKSFADNKINRGPAVMGIKPGVGAAIAGIGTENTDWAYDSESGLYFGNLEVGLVDLLNDPRDFDPSLVSVNNVREEFDNGLFYFAYPVNREASARFKVEIPILGMPTAAIRAYLWFWFVGRSAGAIPTLTATYRRYPKATPTPVELPSSDADIVAGGWDPGLVMVGGDYAYANTPWFDVAVGDTVFFSIGWDGDGGPSEGFGIMRAALHTEIAPA